MNAERSSDRRSELWDAVTRLANDASFRQTAVQYPKLLRKQFELTLPELESLWQVAKLSGVDVKEIDKLRTMEAQQLGPAVVVACCCCCCSKL